MFIVRRAQEESLKLARAEALEKQLEEQEAEQIRLAQQESMKEANVRKEALDRLQKRLACPWNLKINPNTDDEGLFFLFKKFLFFFLSFFRKSSFSFFFLF